MPSSTVSSVTSGDSMDGVMSPSTPSSSMETIERKRARKNAISTTSSKRFVSTRLFDGSSSMMSTGTAVLKKLNGKVPSTVQTAGVPVPMSLAGCCSPTLPLDGGLANGPIFAMPCPSIQSVAQLHPQMIFGALVTSGLTDAPPTQLFSSFPLKNLCRKHSPIDRLQRRWVIDPCSGLLSTHFFRSFIRGVFLAFTSGRAAAEGYISSSLHMCRNIHKNSLALFVVAVYQYQVPMDIVTSR